MEWGGGGVWGGGVWRRWDLVRGKMFEAPSTESGVEVESGMGSVGSGEEL